MISISIWPVVSVAVVAVPGVSLSISVGARLGRGGLISRPLAIVAIAVWSAVVATIVASVASIAVVATIVASVASIAVVAVPRISRGVSVGSREVFSLISRPLSVVAIVAVGSVVASVASPVASIAVVAVPRIGLSVSVGA